METLGEVIERHRHRVWALEVDAGTRRESRKLSNRQLSERSGLHWNTIQDWINSGHVGMPEQLAELAQALVSPHSPHDPTYPAADPVLAELQEAAGLPVGAGLHWDLPADYLMFPAALRAAYVAQMRATGDAILASYGKSRPFGRITRPTSDPSGGGGASSAGSEPGDGASSP